MDGDGGTPNPLNPMPGENNKASESNLAPEDDIKFAEMGEAKEEPTKPASFAQTITVEEPIPEPETKLEAEIETKPESEPETKLEAEIETKPESEPEAKHPLVDPMMRPKTSNFDTLGTSDDVTEEVTVNEITDNAPAEPETTDVVTTTTTIAEDTMPELVAKDSIVEPANGGKKKAFVIGAIIFLMVSIICGAAAIAIAMLGNNEDRVTKAIDKLLNGEIPNIIAVDGEVTSNSAVAESSTIVDFDGTFDLKSSMNKVSAEIEVVPPQSSNFSFGIDELTTKSGDVFFKVSGLKDIIENMSAKSDYDFNATDANATDTLKSENITTIATDCGGENSDLVKCQEQDVDINSFSNLLLMYAGLFDAADDEWILTSGDFADSMSGLGMFDNNSTCLIEAFGTLPKYSKDIANKYKANPFITYSTNDLEIAKKNNPLYRLSFDEERLAAFINSLSSNGFINELNACAGYTATNVDVSSGIVESFFENFPTVYVEIDNNYNFTRVYLKTDVDVNGDAADTTADLELSYPNELKVEQPEKYVEMSTLLNNVMKNLFTTSS